MSKLEQMKAKKASMEARSQRDQYKDTADAALRDLGRYLGAMIADDQPASPADMGEILGLARDVRLNARAEGFRAHVAEVLDDTAAQRAEVGPVDPSTAAKEYALDAERALTRIESAASREILEASTFDSLMERVKLFGALRFSSGYNLGRADGDALAEASHPDEV